MSKSKILLLGSNGLVGSSVKQLFEKEEKNFELIASTRKNLNLFNFEETKSYITNIKPDIIINAAAKVGGIYANNTYRSEFLLENLKININLLESCIPFPEIKTAVLNLFEPIDFFI